MANAEQIKALIKSHIEGDEERFRTIALQMAASAARKGQGKFAEELKSLVDSLRTRSIVHAPTRSSPIPVVQPRGELAGLLSVQYSKLRLNDVVLDKETASRLHRVVLENHQKAKLKSFGLHQRKKLLILGPPGTGKTMTASALAGEMNLPLFTILLDGLITKFMGETAAKLRLIFDAMQSTTGVYLFDEFDSVAGKREARNDVGEIRRVLNSFLQFLEQDQSDSLIIGATNHPELLDKAVFRRFDDVIEYQLPDEERVNFLLQERLSSFDTSSVDWSSVVVEASGLSYADIVSGINDAAKEAILSDEKSIRTEVLMSALRARRNIR